MGGAEERRRRQKSCSTTISPSLLRVILSVSPLSCQVGKEMSYGENKSSSSSFLPSFVRPTSAVCHPPQLLPLPPLTDLWATFFAPSSSSSSSFVSPPTFFATEFWLCFCFLPLLIRKMKMPHPVVVIRKGRFNLTLNRATSNWGPLCGFSLFLSEIASTDQPSYCSNWLHKWRIVAATAESEREASKLAGKRRGGRATIITPLKEERNAQKTFLA